MPFESWVERQIREAQERGEFVCDLVQDDNARVAEAIRRPQEGPLFAIARRLDIDEVLAEWVRRRA
jgi:hypothetical protein